MPKVMVSLPEDVLTDLDREVARRGTSRSALLALAARRELQQEDPAVVDAALAQARDALRDLAPFESADLVRSGARPVTLLVDTSVVLKWFHADGEAEVEASRALLEGHRRGARQVLVLDLAAYELGNVLLRPLRRPASVVAQHVGLLRQLCGPLVHPRPSWDDAAAVLGERHRLTFYDASWAAAAEALSCPLVTADRQLLAAGLGVTATSVAGG